MNLQQAHRMDCEKNSQVLSMPDCADLCSLWGANGIGLREFPNRSALVVHSCDRRVTFADLAAGASELGTSLNLQKNERVAVWLANSEAWVLLMLACSRHGAILVPLHFQIPARLAHGILRLVSANTLVSSQ